MRHLLIYLSLPVSPQFPSGSTPSTRPYFWDAALRATRMTAARIATELVRRGHSVICPGGITAHPLCFAPDAPTHDTWLKADLRLVRICDAMYVTDLDGGLGYWTKSQGIQAEKAEAERLGKSLFYHLDDVPDLREDA